ncbi:MAG TPA: hypothetical protein VKZ81_03855 [Pseudonocardia sp.]|jgi:hypothetical protein|uniref:hypothetical protein n=1 Tax=Pseudonocardia sp. TaxID=60912 RepID=UPI002B4B411F|nr:hypothetical protein [Pseudonocardia sp.]HLU54573.1 hypothetical protein [Pseudonocardia sp.]
MPPELHLRPDALDHHARRASGLADELHEALRGAPDDGEAERLRGVVEAAAAELTELAAVLRGVAAAGSAVEGDVAAALARIGDALGPR